VKYRGNLITHAVSSGEDWGASAFASVGGLLTDARLIVVTALPTGLRPPPLALRRHRSVVKVADLCDSQDGPRCPDTG